MMIKKSTLLLFFFILVFPVNATYAESANLEFAKGLYQQEDYFRAITEAKRYLFNNSEGYLAEEALILIADAYASAGDDKEALKLYAKFISDHPASKNRAGVLVRIGKVYADGHRYKEAAKFFTKASNNPSAPPSVVKRANTWLFLASLLEEDTEYVSRAINAETNITERRNLDDFKNKYEGLSLKSPALAGTLAAIVPGAGHLYLGRKRDAFASFLLNGLFIWGMVESFQNDNVGAGITLSLFEIGWYAGNIYSAVNGAHKHNRRLKDSFKLGFTVDSGLLTSRVNKTDQIRLSLYASF